jgi:hypothetical protein
VRLVSSRVEGAFSLLRSGMPEKKKELLQADLITEVNFDELGMPRVRVHRESHDSIEDANAALMTAV